MLYLIGIGLYNPDDITLRGLNALKSCEHIYLEIYTSLAASKAQFERAYNVEISEADREFVEENADFILSQSKSSNVAILIAGDPLGATTHIDLMIRARKDQITVEVIHNASIFNAIAITGLQLYKFGETVSVPFQSGPTPIVSYVERILSNKQRGLHTLCLLDIRVHEIDWNSTSRTKKQYEPASFMTVAEALKCITNGAKALDRHLEINGQTEAIGVARLGSPDRIIKYGTFDELSTIDFGKPLHSIVVLGGQLHELEIEYLNEFKNEV